MSNPIDIPAVRKAAKNLEEARVALDKARNNYDTVKSLGQNYAVSVNGVRVEVTSMQGSPYRRAVIRGREMIHLGAQKALAAEINDLESDVADLESELRALVLTQEAR